MTAPGPQETRSGARGLIGPGLIGRSLIGLGVVALLAALTWSVGLVWFAITLPAAVEDPDTVTDVIVVLTGGAERVAGGLALLEAGKAPVLFVSGVHRGVDLADLVRQSHPSATTPACAGRCIALGHAADDTVGNASETAAWMRAGGFTSLRLVTAAYHMPRALLEFHRAMPEREIVPHPVFPVAFKRDQWWRWPGTVHLLAIEYSKYLGARLRPLFPSLIPEKKT
ncbi:YdcF family protein [Phaeospirillum tilakii]|uniref:YdcF family protein n=1 Tax=Phaeospirillum tilakii TaxID=741673 RepID=A0ABW5C9T2_9PROT